MKKSKYNPDRTYSLDLKAKWIVKAKKYNIKYDTVFEVSFVKEDDEFYQWTFRWFNDNSNY